MTRIDLDQESITINRRSEATVDHLVEHGNGIPRASAGGEGLHGNCVAVDVGVAIGVLHAAEDADHGIAVVGLREHGHEFVVVIHVEEAEAERGGVGGRLVTEKDAGQRIDGAESSVDGGGAQSEEIGPFSC